MSNLSNKIQRYIQTLTDKGKPGLAVGVVKNDQVLATAAYGLANIPHQVALHPDMSMPIASVTKHMTTVAILMLVDQQRIKLDDKVTQYLPELPANYQSVSIRYLLTHQSGIRCYLDTAFTDGFAQQPEGFALSSMKMAKSQNYKPGEAQIYCNSGYYLASLLIERVANCSFEAFLQSHLFTPLKMNNTRSIRKDWPVPKNIAQSYLQLSQGEYREGINISQERLGDGSVYASLNDMLIWLKCLLAKESLLSEASWSELYKPAVFTNNTPSQYGMGLQFFDLNGRKTIGHGGNVMGANCHMLMLPEHQLGVMVMCNSTLPAEAIAHEIVNLALPSTNTANIELNEQLKTSELDNNLCITGNHFFCQQTGLLLSFSEVEQHLYLHHSLSMPIPVFSANNEQSDTIKCYSKGAVGNNWLQLSNHIVKKSIGGKVFSYTLLTDPPLNVGQYRSMLESKEFIAGDTGASARVIFTAKRIELKCRGRYGYNDFILTPVSEQVFAVSHEVMPFTATLRLDINNNTIAGFYFSTLRSFNLYFSCKNAS